MNRVGVVSGKHHDQFCRSIDDQRESVEDVATEHAHIQRIRRGQRRKLTPKRDLRAVVTAKPDLRCENRGFYNSANSADSPVSSRGKKVECLNDMGTQDGTISPGVN